MTYLLDANVLLRLITKEPLEHAKRALALLQRAEAGEINLILEPMTLAQVTYVLYVSYKYPRALIEEELTMLLQTKALKVIEGALVQRALARMAQAAIDFDDAYLIEKAMTLGCGVASFGRDFEGAGVRWLEP